MNKTAFNILPWFLLWLFQAFGQQTHPGHMKPFGTGLEVRPVHTSHEVPRPAKFFDDYVVTNRPVLFKGAAKKFPTYEKLRNDTYLSETYGKWKVAYEPNQKELRDKVIKYMSFKKFLSTYQKKNYYMVSDVLHPNPITKEIHLPWCVLCADMAGRIETSSMWVSGGGTRSLLHSDGYDNMNCVYSGSKEFYLASPRHEENFYYDGSFSTVDVEKVDFEKYKDLQKVPWFYAKAEAGDCLFLPFKWAHHIKSHGPRNFAVNMFWEHLKALPHREQCEKSNDHVSDLSHYRPMNATLKNKAHWVTMLAYDSKTSEPVLVTKDILCGNMFALDENVTLKQCTKFFIESDTNNDNKLSLEELYNSPVETITTFIENVYAEEGENNMNFMLRYELVNEKKKTEL